MTVVLKTLYSSVCDDCGIETTHGDCARAEYAESIHRFMRHSNLRSIADNWLTELNENAYEVGAIEEVLRRVHEVLYVDATSELALLQDGDGVTE